MPNVIDELITIFSLKDDYTPKAAVASAATADFASATTASGAATADLTTQLGAGTAALTAQAAAASADALALDTTAASSFKLGESLSTVASNGGPFVAMLTGIAAAAAAAGVALAAISLDKFANDQRIELSFEAILGSKDKGQQMMDYVTQFAKTSIFQKEDLAQTTMELSQMGMNMNQWLPTTERLAAMTGKTDPGELETMVELIRRIKGGQLALAMGPRGVGRLGISRDELENKYGAKFSGSGQFEGSISDALDVVQRLAEDRGGPIVDNLKKSLSVGFSNLKDSVVESLVGIGSGLSDSVTPILTNLTNAFNSLTDAGVWKDLGSIIANIFNIDPSQGNLEDGLLKIGETLVWLSVVATEWGDTLNEIGDWLERVRHFWLDPIGSKDKNARSEDDPSMYGIASQIAQNYYDTEKMQLEIQAKKDKKAKDAKAAGAPDPVGDTTTDPQAMTNSNNLSEIAKNTRKMHEDFRKYAFGGGDLGRIGVTPVEMQSFYGSRTNGGGGGLNAVTSALGQLVAEEVNKILGHYMRQRLI